MEMALLQPSWSRDEGEGDTKGKRGKLVMSSDDAKRQHHGHGSFRNKEENCA